MPDVSSGTFPPAGAADRASAAAPSRAQAIASAFVALVFGVTILWGVGFSRIDALHNAAHDTRHSTGFPCH
jgi:cobalt transporter subunit CbtB